jgi:hypothetical protein
MINKVVYIGYMPLTTKVKEDFYFQELIEKKIDVEYWDLTEIFFKDVFNNKLNDKYIFEINSYLLFKDFLHINLIILINSKLIFKVLSLSFKIKLKFKV